MVQGIVGGWYTGKHYPRLPGLENFTFLWKRTVITFKLTLICLLMPLKFWFSLVAALTYFYQKDILCRK